jgi:signal transduction histidine kinase
MQFIQVWAVPMWGRNCAEGALLLKGMRSLDHRPGSQRETPSADDLLPIEMLVTRLQATRSQTLLFEKLIDAEKFASLGQLAGNVTQQLNNPLTVILGYATMLEESSAVDPQDRKGVNAIIGEARRIRSTLESLSRVSREHADLPSAISVSELLSDMEQLYRQEFLQRSIDFQVNLAPGLPRVLCGAQQLRQAVLHCLQYAMSAVEREIPAVSVAEPKTVRLEAASEGNHVQISVSHSGPGFVQQERAFDPFAPAQPGADTDGLGLSLCATILRDQKGRNHPGIAGGLRRFRSGLAISSATSHRATQYVLPRNPLSNRRCSYLAEIHATQGGQAIPCANGRAEWQCPRPWVIISRITT